MDHKTPERRASGVPRDHETSRPVLTGSSGGQYPRQPPPRRLIQALFNVTTKVAPSLRPALQNGLVRAGYEIVSTFGGEAGAFLNFGYTPLAPDATGITLLAEDEPDRQGLQLYYRVTSGGDLRGKDVLEVGSGRGGGASFIMRYLGPRSMTGVDLAASAVAFCRRHHRLDRLTFVKGDAEHLPFPDESFDAVVNVESSHSYPSFEQFLREVARVLRPGGRFLFADMRSHDKVRLLREQIGNSALVVIDEERITDNVLRALEVDTDRRLTFVSRAPRLLRPAVRNFSAVKGTPTFEAFRTGHLEYWRFAMEKRST